MKKFRTVCLVIVALMLLVTACGGQSAENTDPDVNYNDYVKPITDRKITDCITARQVSDAVGVPMSIVGDLKDADATATYQSGDAYYMVTLSIKNSSYDEVKAIATDPNGGWVRTEGIGEVAFWSGDHTELIACADGYAVSVSAVNLDTAVMQTIMNTVLNSLYA